MKPSWEWWRGAPRRSDEVALASFSLVVRLLCVAWAWGRIPPADDGTFYHTLADRLARGLGYTWAWPDGVVTYAAHYPVGYPAWLSLGYRWFGAEPEVAMLGNALLGTLGAWAAYRLGARSGLRGPALLCGAFAALHPSLVAYTPALMTEGVTSALLALLILWAVSASERSRARWLWLTALGVGVGAVVLLRPQLLLLAPVFGAVASRRGGMARFAHALLVTALAVAVCLPWTLRNCERMQRCVFVSANGGWNLFIGSAQGATGAWVGIDELGVPEECRNVFAEAEKDACFGRAGWRNVREHPGRFLRLIPAKMSQTFDFSFAPGHYLHRANPAAFGYSAKIGLGVIEALVERSVLLLALLGLGRAEGPRRRTRAGLAVFGMICLLSPWAWLSHLALVCAVGLFGREAFRRPVALLGASVVFATALTHAVFFGAGRYGLVCVLPLLPLLVDAFRGRPEPAG